MRKHVGCSIVDRIRLFIHGTSVCILQKQSWPAGCNTTSERKLHVIICLAIKLQNAEHSTLLVDHGSAQSAALIAIRHANTVGEINVQLLKSHLTVCSGNTNFANTSRGLNQTNAGKRRR